MPHYATMKIYVLRSLALRDLNLSINAVRGYGDLRCRQTWIDAIEAATSQEAQPAIAHEETPFCIKLRTSDQNDQKLQTDPEIGLIDGQLAVAIPLPQARTVANLVNIGNWAEAFQVVGDNERATRILSRIREVVA